MLYIDYIPKPVKNIYNNFILTIKNEYSITVHNCIDGKDYASNDNMELVRLMADIYKLNQ